jgi:hypothetical protein
VLFVYVLTWIIDPRIRKKYDRHRRASTTTQEHLRFAEIRTKSKGPLRPLPALKNSLLSVAPADINANPVELQLNGNHAVI